jgi:MinD-like ATPase involved in chromosome partitioning or flagellar assembly
MSVDEPTVALVFSPEQWVEELHRHLSHHGGARVRQIVVEPSAALDEEYDVLVVSDRWPSLTLGLVSSVHERGRRLLGVFDPEEPAGKDHLVTLAVDATLPADAPTDEFVAAIRELGARPAHVVARSAAGGWDAPVSDEPAAKGALVATCGPRGSGVTEIAIGVSVAVSSRRRSVALLDAHEGAPALAGRLGLGLEPNLCTAVDACTHGLGSIDDCVVPIARGGGGSVVAIAGYPSAVAAAHVDVLDVLDVITAARRRHEFVVVDLEHQSPTSGAVIEIADGIIGVLAASPVGIVRGLEWSIEAATAAPGVPLHLVVNRAPRHRFRRQEIRAEIERMIRPASIVFCPPDRAVDTASWEGEPVGRGGFHAACAQLADSLDPRGSATRRGHRR